ncbi:L-serine ammonia-lyase, iron-sulfur-dependent, subunit alpha [Paenibacillus sp. N4]|uniref:L-serine ammonia-lyase, iron-sulfur-dependent, subunit alpha n=1 Tax=Paenibacillus vietnamensis TaxID=2590547 RepID=UPI001CD14D41|nr:L-serine ammonia-lyase, iron-sulfur-dependent, subunit alpha [Paenibacillus vietnamensis]MCA0754276.1 L-serine ammonia-lyase, iron-sulfur-dependent, subunit alpha [Paenibacillus vietnamensis]
MRFSTLRQLAERCREEQVTIGQFMLNEQAFETGESKTTIVTQMTDYYTVMKEAVRRGLEHPQPSRSGLTGGDAARVRQYMDRPDGTLLGNDASRALTYALSVSEVNASMGKIVATPTAGSCGIIPGVFVSAQQRYCWADDRLVMGLFCAGAIGYVIANNSFISGAEGGCQAEIGSAVAMAAGAMTELLGGTPEQAVHAVGLALKNSLGLICDPVGGLVEIPCIVRNGFGAVTALAAADMALAGVRSVIPTDEVIEVMHETGRAMPDIYRETAKGGLAGTPTGRKLAKELFSHENGHQNADVPPEGGQR